MKKFAVSHAIKGTFSLSKQAVDALNYTYGWKKSAEHFMTKHLRHDPRLIQMFEEKGSLWMSGNGAEISVSVIEADGYKIATDKVGEYVVPCVADFIIVQ